MANFDTLFDAAIAEWPTVLVLPVRSTGGSSFVVEGLTELGERVSARWVGDPSEVLMVTLHWAISAVVHAAYAGRSRVVPAALDRALVRDNFESNLRRIQSGTVPSWTAEDRALIEHYWSGPMPTAEPHDAEQAFFDEIDGRFPYRDPQRSRALIERGIALSANAAFGVLEEICRPPQRAKLTPAEQTALLDYWRAHCHHPAAPMMAETAVAMIAGRELSVAEVIARINTLAEYRGLYAALAILGMACDDPDGRLDALDAAIRQQWRSNRAQGR
jgi:hypothetical protein